LNSQSRLTPSKSRQLDLRSFDLPQYLATLPLFSDLSPPELERLATGCQMRRLARGEMVFRVGEPCNEFHVAVTGQVKLFACRRRARRRSSS
jgi:signal-transduction protein with cAMP-binding, CBS, and nucleotidyltransferase domain